MNRAGRKWLNRLLSRLQEARLGSLLLAIAPALWCAAPLLRKTPISIDHPTHLFQAWHFWTEMLGRGRLRGWSHLWGFGFPSDELVPCGSEAWVALFRLATFGQLSWTRTYALAFAGLLVFMAFGAYSFTRLYFGKAAAVAGAWITTLDPGQMLQGGWYWHTYYGVWPVSLSMTFVLLSFVRMERVLRAGRTPDVFWAGAWFAAALLTHPLALLAFVVAVPLLLLEHSLGPCALGQARVARVMGALLFGFALAGFYVLPVLTHSNETQDLGWLGDGLAQVSQRFLELRTFDNVWRPVHALAILGAFLAIRSRRPGGMFVAASAGIFVLAASDTLVNDLHIERAFPNLIKIEATRMLLVAKLFWFPLAGYAIVWLLRFAAVAAVPLVPRRRLVRFGVALGVAAGLLLPGCPQFYQTQIKKPIQGERATPLWQDFQAFLAWSQDLKNRSSDLYRIAYYIYRNNHLSTAAPVFNGTPMYKVGSTPVQIFNKLPMTDEDALLEALSVKYVMSEYELNRPSLVLERNFGALRVYRLTTYHPEPFTVLGEGRGELLEFAPERVRIRLSGTTQNSRLKIHVAAFPRWRATISGQEVPIATVPVYGPEYPILMEVPASDGELVLDYVMRRVDWLGVLTSLVAFPAFAMVAWVGRRRRRFELFFADLEHWLISNLWVVVGAVVVLAGVIAARVRGRAVPLPADSIFHRLDGSNLTLDEHPCTLVKDSYFQCGPKAVWADVVASETWGLHYCMTAPAAAHLRLRADLKLGRFLAGNYDPAKEGEGALAVTVAGEELGIVQTRPAFLRQQFIQFDTGAWSNRQATVELSVDGAALHCFDFRVVP